MCAAGISAMFRDVGMMSKQQESPFPGLEKKAFGAGELENLCLTRAAS